MLQLDQIDLGQTLQAAEKENQSKAKSEFEDILLNSKSAIESETAESML